MIPTTALPVQVQWVKASHALSQAVYDHPVYFNYNGNYSMHSYYRQCIFYNVKKQTI